MTGTSHRHFHDALAHLKDRVLQMSGQALDALDRSVRAVLQRDGTAADRVLRDDPQIDALEVEIEEMVTNLLALHQPMARDLRLILAALKITNDLERVGDHAANIAGCAQRLLGQRPTTPEPEIIEMSRLTHGMLADAIDAFVRADAGLGRDVCGRDDQVDALNRSTFRILLTHMAEDPHTIGASMELILVARNLERAADLATNIAEDVVFLVEGKSIKHGAEQQPKGE